MSRCPPGRWFAVAVAVVAAAGTPVWAKTFTMSGINFGASVAAVGPNVLVGAPRDADHPGLAFFFCLQPGSCGVLPPTTDMQTFFAPPCSTPPCPGDAFGFSVAAVGTTQVLVGAPADDTMGPDAGGAYLFTVGMPEPTRRFLSPAAVPHEAFGYAVAAVGDAFLIGAPGQGIAAPGRVYLFTTDPAAAPTTLISPTASVGDGFGTVVGSVGGNPLVGAPFDTGAQEGGAAYLFLPSGPLTLRLSTSAPGVLLGASLAALGTRVVVGAPLDSAAAPVAGAVYLFDPASPDSPRRLQLDSPASGTLFGASVAALGSDLLVGAPYDNTGAQRAGAAYVIDPDMGAVRRVLRQREPFPVADTRFGVAVAAVGTSALIGAPGAGSVYLCVCGDGGPPDFACGEQCDDGNTVDGDGCSADCQIECSTDNDCTPLRIDCLQGSTCDVESRRCRLSPSPPGTPCRVADRPCVSGCCDGSGVCNAPCNPSGAPTALIVAESACDDNNACTTDSFDRCTGKCVHTPVECAGGDTCTTDCDPQTGQCRHDPVCDTCLLCDYFQPQRSCCGSLRLGQCGVTRRAPDGTVCDDGNLCTSDDRCLGGRCVGQPACKARHPCTADADCNDGNPCDGIETCRDGECVAGTPPECFGHVPCTLMSSLEVSPCPGRLPGAVGRHLMRARKLLQEAADAAQAGRLRVARKRLRQASASLPTAKAIRRAKQRGSILPDCADALGAMRQRIKMLRQELPRCAG